MLNAEWPEFDLDAGFWTIPAARMKARKEHRVALSARALAIVKEISTARTSKFVFPARSLEAAFQHVDADVLGAHGSRGAMTAHGFRSSFSDWASEVSPFSSELREAALAHTIGNKAEAAYRRGDALEKRRAMMEAWAHGASQGRRMSSLSQNTGHDLVNSVLRISALFLFFEFSRSAALSGNGPV